MPLTSTKRSNVVVFLVLKFESSPVWKMIRFLTFDNLIWHFILAKKCKEMLINFMQSDNFTTRPIVPGNNTVECVATYKLFGIIISNDLKWN